MSFCCSMWNLLRRHLANVSSLFSVTSSWVCMQNADEPVFPNDKRRTLEPFVIALSMEENGIWLPGWRNP